MECKSLVSDAEKAIEAAGVLLRMEPNSRMGKLRLLKLLYIASRRAIKELGRPILRSAVVAMRHGPVHGEVLDLIKENHADADRWATYIRREGPRTLHLAQQPPLGKLSRHEVEILQGVVDELAGMEDHDLVDLTRSYVEWQDNYPNKQESTSRPIPRDELIRAAAAESDAETVVAEVRELEEFDRLFSS